MFILIIIIVTLYYVTNAAEKQSQEMEMRNEK